MAHHGAPSSSPNWRCWLHRLSIRFGWALVLIGLAGIILSGALLFLDLVRSIGCCAAGLAPGLAQRLGPPPQSEWPLRVYANAVVMVGILILAAVLAIRVGILVPREHHAQGGLVMVVSYVVMLALVLPFLPYIFSAMPFLIWVMAVACSYIGRGFIVQYVGDVAAYVSAHAVNKFWEVRENIRTRSLGTARAIYGACQDATAPASPAVGASTGSRISDALPVSPEAAAARPITQAAPDPRGFCTIMWWSSVTPSAQSWRTTCSTGSSSTTISLPMQVSARAARRRIVLPSC